MLRGAAGARARVGGGQLDEYAAVCAAAVDAGVAGGEESAAQIDAGDADHAACGEGARLVHGFVLEHAAVLGVPGQLWNGGSPTLAVLRVRGGNNNRRSFAPRFASCTQDD